MKAKQKTQAEVLPANPTSSKPEWLRKLNDGKYLLILVVPAMVCLALFYYFPMYGLIISFKDYQSFVGLKDSPWVGLEHFKMFIEQPNFWKMIKNTFLLSFWTLLWGFPAPIILALLLNDLRSMRFKKWVQTISYMPHFLSTVIVVGLVNLLFSPSTGIIPDVMANLGVKNFPDLLSNAKYFRTIYIISGIWSELGWGAIIYLAALTNVDPQLYEAATVDGAGKLRCLWSITLPSITPTIITMFLLRMGSVFNIGFEKAWLLQVPSNLETSEIISTYVYKQGISGANYSYGAAVGLFNSLVSLTLVIISNYVSRTVSETSLW